MVAVGSVRRGHGREHRTPGPAVTRKFPQPSQAAQVAVLDVVGQLDLDPEHAPITTLQDHVDLGAFAFGEMQPVRGIVQP